MHQLPSGQIEFELPRENGIILKGNCWSPGVSPDHDRKFLVLTHGACEHHQVYQPLLSRAAELGWTAISYDLRGHGLSTGNDVHVDQFQDYVQDLYEVLQLHRATPERTFLIGCSMGGLISIRAIQQSWQQQQQPLCRRLALLSPLLGLKHPIESWKKIISHAISERFPRTRFRSTLKTEMLTHDQEQITIKKADPLMRKHVTARWFWESQRAISQAYSDISDFRVPTLLLQSQADFVVDPLAAKSWADKVNRSVASSDHSSERPLIAYHALLNWYHEIINEQHWPDIVEVLLTDAARDWTSAESAIPYPACTTPSLAS